MFKKVLLAGLGILLSVSSYANHEDLMLRKKGIDMFAMQVKEIRAPNVFVTEFYGKEYIIIEDTVDYPSLDGKCEAEIAEAERGMQIVANAMNLQPYDHLHVFYAYKVDDNTYGGMIAFNTADYLFDFMLYSGVAKVKGKKHDWCAENK